MVWSQVKWSLKMTWLKSHILLNYFRFTSFVWKLVLAQRNISIFWTSIASFLFPNYYLAIERTPHRTTYSIHVFNSSIAFSLQKDLETVHFTIRTNWLFHHFRVCLHLNLLELIFALTFLAMTFAISWNLLKASICFGIAVVIQSAIHCEY